MSISSDESDFPWPGNTVWIEDSSSIESALDDSDNFRRHSQYGEPPEDVGAQYVAPDAGIVVNVNYSRDNSYSVKAATIEDSNSEGISTIDEVSKSAYDEAVSEYVNDILVESNDIGTDPQINPEWLDNDFREGVESWFDAAYEDAGRRAMPYAGEPTEVVSNDQQMSDVDHTGFDPEGRMGM